MAEVSLTGQDTVQIDGRILQSLADQAAFDITFPDDLAAIKVGKNSNTIYAMNNQGLKAEVSLRVLLGTSDDKYLNSRMLQWILDPSSFELLTGMFVKRVGDGAGNLDSKIYQCSGGVFKRQIEAKTSSEGDTDQSVAVYSMIFGNCQVSIQ